MRALSEVSSRKLLIVDAAIGVAALPAAPVSLVGHTTDPEVPVVVPFALAVYEVTAGEEAGICQTICSLAMPEPSVDSNNESRIHCPGQSVPIGAIVNPASVP